MGSVAQGLCREAERGSEEPGENPQSWREVRRTLFVLETGKEESTEPSLALAAEAKAS